MSLLDISPNNLADSIRRSTELQRKSVQNRESFRGETHASVVCRVLQTKNEDFLDSLVYARTNFGLFTTEHGIVSKGLSSYVLCCIKDHKRRAFPL